MKDITNIIIVGLGGQGVNALSSTIQKSLLNNDTYCKGAIFKGGAQKRGAVYAMIRIFKNKEMGQYLAATIPKGDLDIIVSLEANEALRYVDYYDKNTQILINDYQFPFYNERFKKRVTENPIQGLSKHFKNLMVKDYTNKSLNLFNTEKMVNVLMGLELVNNDLIPLDKLMFLEELEKKTKIKYEDMVQLMEM